MAAKILFAFQSHPPKQIQVLAVHVFVAKIFIKYFPFAHYHSLNSSLHCLIEPMLQFC